ncbi:hypothetical protein [Halorubellus sp. PRR65]|uniref:hypothetical protein n=1 Tax=Halorubellus sp. PRR65 TaxID=3098148 RepID=UPI002B25C368|nr:hypothetical protein [Halorubellus sp. PRR65]
MIPPWRAVASTVQLPKQPLQSGGGGAASPLVGLALVGAGVAVLVLFAAPSARRLRAMFETETVPVAEATPGRVEVEGTVEPAAETLDVSAGAKKAEAVVSQSRQHDGDHGNDDDGGFFVPLPQQLVPDVLSKTGSVPFYVADDTGRILVDPAYADVRLESDYARHDELSDSRRVEAWLEPGDGVYVLGEAVPASEYDERATAPSGPVRSVVEFLKGGVSQTADAVARDELVVTRTADTVDFVVSDATGTRSWLRQALGTVVWSLVGALAVVGGGYLVLGGLLGL